MNDVERLRLQRDSLLTLPTPKPSTSSHAFVGKVTTISPSLGKFVLVTPETVTGAESEGGAGTFADGLPHSVAVYPVGPGKVATGDLVVCKYVEDRWVTEKTSPRHVVGGKCVYQVTVLDATTGGPISGVSVDINYRDLEGNELCSGTTDEAGVFICSLDTPPITAVLTVSIGGCVYTSPLTCGVDLILYYCLATVQYEALDDGGGPVTGVKYFATPAGSARVVSMTGGTGPDLFGAWNSTTPGTAVLCWFGTSPAPGLVGNQGGLGAISEGPFAPSTPPQSGNDTYWDTCLTSQGIPCGTSHFCPVYYRKALWNAMPCCVGQLCVDHNNALPKQICVTIDGPSEIFGGDAGERITLDWDDTTWDGDIATYSIPGGFGFQPNHMTYTTGCRGGNGAGGYCIHTVRPTGAATIGDFVPFKSSRVDLTITATAFFAVGPHFCDGGVAYQNFWNDGCPANDPAPCVCPNDGTFTTPCPDGIHWPADLAVYCPHSVEPLGPGIGYGGVWPKSVGFNLVDLNRGGLSFFGCEPIAGNWIESEGAFGGGWKSACGNPYDPTFGLEASIVVDACGDPAPVDPECPTMMMEMPPAERKAGHATGRMKAARSASGGPFPKVRDDARINVGLVSPVCYPGGADEWTRQVAGSLDPARFAVLGLAVLNGRGASDPGMVARIDPLAPVAFGREAGVALAGECDVLLGWDMGDFPASLAGGPSRPAVVMVSHSPPQSEWGIRAMSKVEGVDRLAAVSELARGTIPAERRDGAAVIWNAVDPGRLAVRRPREAMRAAWGVPSDADVTGYYGRLSDEKGVDGLLRMASSLPAGHFVVVVGEGPLRKGLGAEMRSLGLDNIRFPGDDPAAGDVLNAFDRLASLSRFESFGLSMAEAMWTGVPLIATPAGLPLFAGVDVARPVPFDADGPTLAAAVMDDLADAEGTAARAARAKAFARERFSPGRFASEWSDYLAEVAADRPMVETPRKPPGFIARAVSLGRAVADHAADGGRKASPEVQAERERICKSNVCGLHDASKDGCKSCGCGLSPTANWLGIDLKLKRSWASSSCPKGQWLADPE